MSEREAALCSWHEYELRSKAYERQAQQRWELARWQVWQLLSPHYKKGQAPKTPQAFCRFPWEGQTDQQIHEAYKRSRITPAEQEWLDRMFPRQEAEVES